MRRKAKAASAGPGSGRGERRSSLALAPAPRRRTALAGLPLTLSACLCLSLLSAAPADAAGPCPNEAIREAQASEALPAGATYLPNCMALEMVSPPNKAGQPTRFPNVSADGSRVSFTTGAALGEDPGGNLTAQGATYVASRGGSGWTSASTVPDRGFSVLWELSSQRRPSFSPDFARWFGIGAVGRAQREQGIDQAYEAGPGGFFSPLSELLRPLSFSGSTPLPQQVVEFAEFQGASADRSHLYFLPGIHATYLPNDPKPFESEPGNVYLARIASGGQTALELPQRDRTGKVWGGSCGARLGGIGSYFTSTPNGARNQGAVSADGSRTYLSARASQPEGSNCDEAANKLRILERLETPTGPQIGPLFASECSRVSPPCGSADGNDLYQGASLDQTKVYFTTNRQLTNSDRDGSSAECSLNVAAAGCDLYLYDRARPEGERLLQVSAGEDVPTKHEAGKEAKVFNGISAISADGSHAYFVATGVLTNHTNPEGKVAQAGEPNLYLWDAESEATAFLGTLASADQIINDFGRGLWGGQGTWRDNAYPVPVLGPAEQGGERGEEGGDGHVLVFESRAKLTANDADGTHLDVYRYDADTETLQCLSCKPGSSASEPDAAPFNADERGTSHIPGGDPGRGEAGPLGTDFAESLRWVSEDGGEAGFLTAEPLVPGDLDGVKDAYLWRAGQLFRLPGTPPPYSADVEGLPGPTLSHDGLSVAWVTATPLLPQDGDKADDVYVARVDGGFANPPAPHPCEPGNPSNECQQAQVAPGAPQAASEAAGPGNPPAPPPCGKGKVRRKGRCIAKPRHKAKKRHHARHANTNRRAGR